MAKRKAPVMVILFLTDLNESARGGDPMSGSYRFLCVIGLLSTTILFVRVFAVDGFSPDGVQTFLSSYSLSVDQSLRDMSSGHILRAGLISAPDLGWQSATDPSTRVERVFSRIKNNSLLAVLVVLGTIIVALAAFTDALNKLFDLTRYSRPESARARLSGMSLNFDGKDFIQSIKAKDIHLVKLFLAAKMNPNVTYDCGMTALIHAVMCGDKDIIQALLKAG